MPFHGILAHQNLVMRSRRQKNNAGGDPDVNQIRSEANKKKRSRSDLKIGGKERNMKTIDVMRCMLVKEKSVRYEAKSPSEAVNVFRAFGLTDAAEEILAMISIGEDGSVNGIHEISHGTVNRSIVHPREVLKRAILNNASSIVIAHNHPSGSLKVSEDDIMVTERLKEAADIIGIPIEDHLVISRDGYVSLHDEGII